MLGGTLLRQANPITVLIAIRATNINS